MSVCVHPGIRPVNMMEGISQLLVDNTVEATDKLTRSRLAQDQIFE